MHETQRVALAHAFCQAVFYPAAHFKKCTMMAQIIFLPFTPVKETVRCDLNTSPQKGPAAHGSSPV